MYSGLLLRNTKDGDSTAFIVTKTAPCPGG